MNQREELELFNRWWFDDAWHKTDKHISKWQTHEIKWLPEWLKQISLKPFSLNFVIGPRQVGKTTGIKLLIKQLIEKGVSEEKIVYFDVGLVPTIESFKKLLSSLRNYEFIFLDEVTSVNDWWKVLRAYVDSGIFKDCVIVVTASASIRIKKHAELFPGRTGKGKIVEVIPLSFPQLVKVLYGSKKAESSKLRKAFRIYTKFGGFPLSINEGDNAITELIKSVEGEMAKLDLSIETASKIICSLMSKIPSALSYQSIAGDIGISYKTVEYYLEKLKGLYILNTAYWKHNEKISFRKEKKIFFRDPFIYHAFSFWTGTKFLESALFEGIVQEHLLRKFGEIYYFKNSYEIDCIAGDLKVEVKAGKPHRKYPRNVKVLDEEDLPRFLLELFFQS